jgi:hypothetical protein
MTLLPAKLCCCITPDQGVPSADHTLRMIASYIVMLFVSLSWWTPNHYLLRKMRSFDAAKYFHSSLSSGSFSFYRCMRTDEHLSVQAQRLLLKLFAQLQLQPDQRAVMAERWRSWCRRRRRLDKQLAVALQHMQVRPLIGAS